MSKLVLIVDDIADTREMMRFFIEDFGYLVIEAANGFEAVEKSKIYEPDLILMDLALPLMDGSAAMKIIRENEKSHHVSIVAITGFGNVSFDKAIEAGFDGIIHKPVEFDFLEPILNHYLEH